MPVGTVGKYTARPTAPPKTAVPWETNKRCYTAASKSAGIVDPKPLKDTSEYHLQYSKKKTAPSGPNFSPYNDGRPVSVKTYPQVLASGQPDADRSKAVGRRGYAPLYVSHMPWTVKDDPTKKPGYQSRISSSEPGLLCSPSPYNPPAARKTGLRASAYSDKYRSTVFTPDH